jgi:hypothetical protein
MVLCRITIDSTRLSVAVTPFARLGPYGRVLRQRSRRNPLLPVLSRPGRRGPLLRGLIERYTEEIKELRHQGDWIRVTQYH